MMGLSARLPSPPTFTIMTSGHDKSITCLAWLPHDRIVTGSVDGTVRIWNPTNGAQEGASMTHEASVRGIVTTTDGRIISCTLVDQHLMVWNADTQELVNGPWLNDQYGPAYALALSQDEELLASIHKMRIIIQKRAGSSMQVRSEFETEFMSKLGSFALSIEPCFSTDGKSLALCFNAKGMIVLDVESGQINFEGPAIAHGSITAVVWTSTID